jgi:hypothetical protein
MCLLMRTRRFSGLQMRMNEWVKGTAVSCYRVNC